ncbi:MAG: GNAT family N-acetyltransferase [Nannocystaceae bacterium]
MVSSGAPEKTAVLDTLVVHPGYRGKGIGRSLVRQLRQNLVALRIGTLRTEVHWDDQQLLSFFHHEGFQPAPRFCLELGLG